jgi:polyisoprenoid-binding protein YceI
MSRSGWRARTWPAPTSHATEIRRSPAGGQSDRYVARGTLALKGVQQAVEVPFSFHAAADGATMEGEFSVKRGPFGIGTGEWTATDVIGADVAVKFRVQLREVR